MGSIKIPFYFVKQNFQMTKQKKLGLDLFWLLEK